MRHSPSLVSLSYSFGGEYLELSSIHTGTAVYIYFILSNYPASSGLFSDVLCNFLLDGTNVGSYTHNTDGTKVFQYNVLVFSQTGLSNGLHTFVIQPANNFALGNYIIFMQNIREREIHAPLDFCFSLCGKHGHC